MSIEEIELQEDQVAMTLSYDEDKTFIRFEFISSTAIEGDEILEYLQELIDKYEVDPEKLFEDGIVQQRVFN